MLQFSEDEMVDREERRTAKEELAAAKRLEAYELTLEELKRLQARLLEGCHRIGSAFIEAVREEVYFQEHGPGLADEFDFPASDDADIIRCIHEGCCAVCGRRAYLIETRKQREYLRIPDGHPSWNEVKLEDWDDREEMMVECSSGHQWVAEPLRNGDWTSYRNDQ